MYEKVNFYTGSRVSAAQLDHVEEGIVEAHNLIASGGISGAPLDFANLEKGGEGSTQQKIDPSRLVNENEWDFGNRNPNAANHYEAFIDDPNKDPNDSLIGRGPFKGYQVYGATGIYSATFGGSNKASGPRSFAINNRTIAAGDESFAQGYCSIAAGNGSFAGGSSTYARGTHAVSLGQQTQAMNTNSFAIGGRTIASGENAVSEGVDTVATGYASHALGNGTVSAGTNSFAGGLKSYVGENGNSSFSYGIHTVSDHNFQFVIGRANLNSSDSIFEVGNGTTEEIDGVLEAATRSTAFRVTEDGRAKISNVSLINIQPDDLVCFEVFNNVATAFRNDLYEEIAGVNKDITEINNKVDSLNVDSKISNAIGNFHIENGTGHYSIQQKSSHTSKNEATGINSAAFGTGSKAKRENASAFGYYSIADGDNAHASGWSCYAYADASHAEGAGSAVYAKIQKNNGNGSSGNSSPLTDNDCGKCAHAEGNNTIALGYSAHAEGTATKAYGHYSHAEGTGTITGYTKDIDGTHYVTDVTCGKCAHAEGIGTRAKGNYSHAEGFYTEALADNSHTSGNNTVSNHPDQTIVGKFNKNKSTTLFEIGNGTDSSETGRSNAFEVYADGHAELNAVGNTDKSVITKEYLTNNSSCLYTHHFDIVLQHQDLSLIPEGNEVRIFVNAISKDANSWQKLNQLDGGGYIVSAYGYIVSPQIITNYIFELKVFYSTLGTLLLNVHNLTDGTVKAITVNTCAGSSANDFVLIDSVSKI